MSLPAVVQHLQVLEASGLVRSKKVGRARICRIEAKALRAAERWVTDQRTSWSGVSTGSASILPITPTSRTRGADDGRTSATHARPIVRAVAAL
jgi:hypothetical protein